MRLILTLALVASCCFPCLAACPGRYSTLNTGIAVAQAGLIAYDCTQTVRILHLPGGYEADPLVPAFITTANRAARPGDCIAAGVALTGLEYALLRCHSPFYMGVGFIGEAINVHLNYQLLRSK